MALDFNFQAIGNLVKDAESRIVGEYHAITLTLAINKKYKDETKASFLPVTYWTKSNKILDYLKKGIKIAIAGDWYENNPYTRTDGTVSYFQNFTARELKVLTFENAQQPTGTTAPAPTQHSASLSEQGKELMNEEDDLPF